MAFRTNRGQPAVHVPASREARSSWPWARSWLGLSILFALGCGLAEEGTLSPDKEDPATLKTPSGAMARYREVVVELGPVVDRAMTIGGAMTDELTALPLPVDVAGPFTVPDSRQDGLIGTFRTGLAARLFKIRVQASESRGFLRAYAPDSSPALAGHLAAIQGYAEVYLADLFCSGIPLSTVHFDGDYTLAAGSTTNEVYEHAIALFDSAATLASDSIAFQRLAAVGRGRALLALGRYAEAAAAVAAVPVDYRYQTSIRFVSASSMQVPDTGALFWFTQAGASRLGALSMGDREGGTGVAYLSDGDPRTAPWTEVRTDGTNRMWFPRKFTPNGNGTGPVSPVTINVASGVEARLIEAEAALQAASSTWLTILNTLRTAGTFDTQPRVDNPAVNDTLWHAGTGGVAGLRPLEDPGTFDAQVDLLFRERAFWLYLEGYRQGDLRRLIRNYFRDPVSVYPGGFYPGGNGTYGGEITVPIPDEERQLNPKYLGCFHRSA